MAPIAQLLFTAIAFVAAVLYGLVRRYERQLGKECATLWYNGHKTSVLAIAEQRLAANSKDLAGLIIKMEFNMASNGLRDSTQGAP